MAQFKLRKIVFLTLGCCWVGMALITSWSFAQETWQEQVDLYHRQERGEALDVAALVLEQKFKQDFYESSHFKLKHMQAEITKIGLMDPALKQNISKEELREFQLLIEQLNAQLNKAFFAPLKVWPKEKIQLEAQMGHLIFYLNRLIQNLQT